MRRRQFMREQERPTHWRDASSHPKPPGKRYTSVPCFQTEDIINDLLSLSGAQYEHRHSCMGRCKHEEQSRFCHSRSVCNLHESWSPQIRREKLSSLNGMTLRAGIPYHFRCSAGGGRQHQKNYQASGSFHDRVLPTQGTYYPRFFAKL